MDGMDKTTPLLFRRGITKSFWQYLKIKLSNSLLACRTVCVLGPLYIKHTICKAGSNAAEVIVSFTTPSHCPDMT